MGVRRTGDKIPPAFPRPLSDARPSIFRGIFDFNVIPEHCESASLEPLSTRRILAQHTSGFYGNSGRILRFRPREQQRGWEPSE